MASRRSRSPDSSHERDKDRKGKKPKVCCSDDEAEADSSKDPLAESYKLIDLMTPEKLKQLQKRVNNFVTCHEIWLKVKEDDATRRRKAAEESDMQEEYDKFRHEQFRHLLASDAESEAKPDWEPFQHVPEPYSPDEEVEKLAQADLEEEIEADKWNDFLMGPVVPEEEYAQALVDAEDEEDDDEDYEEDETSEVIDKDVEEVNDENEEYESEELNGYDEYEEDSTDDDE
ncbi:acidic leucine-rich nuclear phosphoprotein 32 family member B-like [Papaver somniferum]|uniref:acidic leucine-rich nuclear phosphoprotein 32 family member B-like n=1 Tax=Papaver somniferum TaxID=3469 RepID=UPI000E6FE1DA|nr:acidic leucine-rich nuclear phosphoprotein 32 family member B-like [Papaver somniferum]